MITRRHDLRDGAVEAAEVEQRMSGAIGHGYAPTVEAHARRRACGRQVAHGNERLRRFRRAAGGDQIDLSGVTLGDNSLATSATNPGTRFG